MALERAATLYPRNSTTVDTGAGIDVRLLDDVNGGTNDATQQVQATHTQDNVDRTFDPATTGVTAASAPSASPLLGWALRLTEDMTPADDTNCNASLPAQTATVVVDVTMSKSASGIDTGGTQSPTWKCALWRYNPSTDTGTLIASGSQGGTTWQTATIGNDEGTYKQVSISVTVPLTEFAAGEILLVAIGVNTGTLTNPSTGTTTYFFNLRVDDANTKIAFAAGSGVHQVCVLTSNVVGEGETTRVLGLAESKNVVGEAAATSSKVTAAAKTTDVVGEGAATRSFDVALPRSLSGEAAPTHSKVTVAAKTANVVGESAVTRVLDAALPRNVVGEGTPTSAKAVIAAKTIDVVGEGAPTMSKLTAAARSYDLAGEGTPTHSKVTAASKTADVVGEGTPTAAKVVVASKTIEVAGEGTVDSAKAVVASKSFDLAGEATPTFEKATNAARTFDVVGEGKVLVNGPNGTTITIPIDEVPEGVGGTTVIKRPIIIFDD